jgi:hypothetical protein
MLFQSYVVTQASLVNLVGVMTQASLGCNMVGVKEPLLIMAYITTTSMFDVVYCQVYYTYPYCGSRMALTPPNNSAIPLNPIYPQAFSNPSLGYCQELGP